MFFNKKKPVEEVSPIVYHFKELWNEVSESYKSIHRAMLTVIACEEIIRLYPEGADKDVAIKRLEEAKNKFRNTLAAYDDAKGKLMQYYAVKKYDVDFDLPSWNPYQWKESVDVVECLYRNEKKLWVKNFISNYQR